MATASITYDYPYFWYTQHKYGVTMKHTQTSGEYLSPPHSEINYFSYLHFNNTIPYLKSIRVHYTIYCNNYRIIGSYNHGLYVRVGSRWYLAGSVSLSYKTSDDDTFTYMGEIDIDVTVDRSNVTDFCILPTDLPNGTYEWSSSINLDGRLTIQESLTEIAMEDSDYLTNIFRGNILKNRESNAKVEDFLESFYDAFSPNVLTLDIGDELVNATEVYVNIGGTNKKVTQKAKIATGSWSWSSYSYCDEALLFSFTAEYTSYKFNIVETPSDDSFVSTKFLIDASTNTVTELNSEVLSSLVVGRKYYLLFYVIDGDYDDASLSVDILLYPIVGLKQIIENTISITATQTSLSFSESGTMRSNFCGLIKLNVTTLPANMYFMLYNLKISSYEDGFMSIYDSDGNQLYRCDDNSAGWTKLSSTHPTLGSKTTYPARDPLIMTTESHANGPFYIEFRKLNLSGTSIMNYTIEWGSL